jgi:hypothetical protein
LPCKINQKHPQGFGDQPFAQLRSRIPLPLQNSKDLQLHKTLIFWLISPEAGLLSEEKNIKL